MIASMHSDPDDPQAPQGSSPSTPAYLDPYLKATEQFGPSFEATLWASEKWQRVRFRIACELQDMNGRVVLDAGCARGDFARYMVDEGIEYGRFIGLEGVADLARAAEALGLPEAEFHTSDFAAEKDAFTRHASALPGRSTPGPDVIVFSGALNTFEIEAACAVLARAWDACAESLIFNFLSDRAGKTRLRNATGPARRFDTLGLVDWALDRTPRVALRHEYLPDGHDATIAMYKG